MLELIENFDICFALKGCFYLANDASVHRRQFIFGIWFCQQQSHVQIAIGPQFIRRCRTVEISGIDLRMAVYDVFELINHLK